MTVHVECVNAATGIFMASVRDDNGDLLKARSYDGPEDAVSALYELYPAIRVKVTETTSV
jgi:hypothetical protein